MPLRDGTGPLGLGPGSGRGKGRCYTGFGYRSMSRTVFHGRPGWLLGIAVPLVAAVLRDLLNPSSMICRIVNLSLRQRIADNKQDIVRQAEFSVMNGSAVPIDREKGNDK